jgi:hypothetical protein
MILDMISRLLRLTEVDGSMVPLKELDDTQRLEVGTKLNELIWL